MDLTSYYLLVLLLMSSIWLQVNHHQRNSIQRHALLGVPVCRACKYFYEDDGVWEKDEQGSDCYCRLNSIKLSLFFHSLGRKLFPCFFTHAGRFPHLHTFFRCKYGYYRVRAVFTISLLSFTLFPLTILSKSDSSASTICPGSSNPFYIVTHYRNWGNYFLDTQYI